MPATPADDQLEWVLVAKGTSTPTPPAPTEGPALEPEPEKVNAGLAQAQEELDRVQWIVESSVCCLIEPRREFPIEKFGILDAYIPSERIDVVSATTTLTSIILSGLRFFQVYGLPDRRNHRLLGKTKYAHINEEGVISGFTDMSHLSPTAQNRRMEAYDTGIRSVVRGFLLQFSGHQTFYRSPEVVVKIGAPITILQKHLVRRGTLSNMFSRHCFDSYMILNAMEAMTTKEPTEIAELALKFYEEIKGPMKNRVLVLKSIGIHQKDLNAAAAYLVTAVDPIPCPTSQDLEVWTGVKSQTSAMDILSELQVTSLENEIRTERMAVILTAILKKVIKLDKAASGPPTEGSDTTESVVPSREGEQQESSLKMVTGDNSYSKV